jgi:hypothetical protein
MLAFSSKCIVSPIIAALICAKARAAPRAKLALASGLIYVFSIVYPSFDRRFF